MKSICFEFLECNITSSFYKPINEIDDFREWMAVVRTPIRRQTNEILRT